MSHESVHWYRKSNPCYDQGKKDCHLTCFCEKNPENAQTSHCPGPTKNEGIEVMTKLATIKKRWMKGAKVKAEYKQLAPEFKIATALIDARMKAHLTQKELADMMGTTQSVIARLEGGSQLPSMKSLFRYAHALGKDIEIRIT